MAKKKVIEAEVAANREVARDHFVMEVKAPYLGKNAAPGQFVMVRARDEGTDPLIRRPLGVHAIRKSGISLLYKVVGTATRILSGKRPGEALNIMGPLGNGFDLGLARGGKGKVVILAGGHGAAPLYALAEGFLREKKEVDVFLGAGTKGHVVCARELKELGASVRVATEDGTAGHKGYVTDLFEEHLELDERYLSPDTAIYACGPRPMLARLARALPEGKVKAQASLDAYMACGTGACLGCAVRTKSGYKMVCKDGPVFGLHDIDWKMEGR